MHRRNSYRLGVSAISFVVCRSRSWFGLRPTVCAARPMAAMIRRRLINHSMKCVRVACWKSRTIITGQPPVNW